MEPKAKQMTQKYFIGAVFSVEATCSNMEIHAWISSGASRRGWFSSLCPLAVLICDGVVGEGVHLWGLQRFGVIMELTVLERRV